MIGDLLRYDGPLAKWLNRMLDLFALNVLTVLCCIPVFTAGASISAMHYCTMKMNRGEEGSVTKDFFHSFRDHFGQSVALTGIYLGSGLLLLICVYVFHHVDFGVWDGLRYVLYFALLVHFVLFTYVFPVFARFDNTVKNTLKNAYILAVRFPVNSVVVTLTTGLPWLVAILWPWIFARIFFVWLFIGFALQAYWTSGFFLRVFERVEAPRE